MRRPTWSMATSARRRTGSILSSLAVEPTLGVTAVAAFIAAGATSSLGRSGLADGCTTVALAATGFLGMRGLVGERRQRRVGHDQARHEGRGS